METPPERLERLQWLATEKHFPHLATAIKEVIARGEMPDGVDWESASLDGFIAKVASAHDRLSLFATLPVTATSPTVAGDFRLVTQDMSGTAAVEWIGDPSSPTCVTLILGMPHDRPDLSMRNHLLVQEFLSIYGPGDLPDGWWQSSLDQVGSGSPVVFQFLTLSLVGGLLMLTATLSSETPAAHAFRGGNQDDKMN